MKDINLIKAGDSFYLKVIHAKTELSSSDDCDGYFIDTKESEARRIIDSLKGKQKIIALLAQDNIYNRRALETLRINYLVFPERGEKKDSLKQRDSGLNHVLAKEAKKREIALLISFIEVSKLEPEKKAAVLARIQQNIAICAKAKCKLKIASFAREENEIASPKARSSFLLSLGANTKMAKEALQF